MLPQQIVPVIHRVAMADPGLVTGENRIPLPRDKSTAPYAFIQPWGEGNRTGECFDASDNTIKDDAAYADCALRFTADVVTADWWLTIPPLLPSGTYKCGIRTGVDGAETNADPYVDMVFFRWDMTRQCIITIATDAFAIY